MSPKIPGVDIGALDYMAEADGRYSGPRGMKGNSSCLVPGSMIHWQSLEGQPPEIGLIAAMLWRAVLDWIELSPRSKHGHTARAWIGSLSLEPGSYLWACDALGMDPARIRRRLDL